MKSSLIKKNMILFVMFILVGTCITSSISIEKSTSSDVFYPTDDCYISMRYPDLNTGSELRINIGNRYGVEPIWEFDGLIKFDLSDINSDSIVKSAKLNLYYYKYENTNPRCRILTLYRVLEDWDEDIVTWNTNKPNYNDVISSSTVVPSSLDTWMIWNVTEDVQDFVSGSKENYGWQIMDEIYWGEYNIPTTNFRTKEYGTCSPYLEIEYKIDNTPPNKPKIDGTPSGKTGTSYVYSTFTVDPDGDKLYYKFNWGDGTSSEWIGTFDSGTFCNESHSWDNEETFVVKVKAKDIKGAESDWATLEVTIPKTRALYNINWFSFLERLPLLQKILNQILPLRCD